VNDHDHDHGDPGAHAQEGDGHAHPTGGHGHSHPHDGAAGRHHDDHDHSHGVLGAIRHLLAGHSHDPVAAADAALTGSREGTHALAVSLVALLMTGLLQAVVVAMSGSVALLADTIHNVADALTAVPLGFAFWLGRRRPTRRYTYGFGRFEDLAGIFILAMIALSSVVALWESIHRLANPRDVDAVWFVAAAGVIGFAGNELVAVYRIRVGRRIGSAALVADGLHARTDGLTSLAVVIGAAGTAAGWRWADPTAGLVITIAILGVLRSAAREIYRRLMDAVDPSLVDDIEATLRHVEGIRGVESVRVRWIGHELHADAEVLSDATLSLHDAHEMAENARHELLHRIPRLADALIHSSPDGSDGHDPHAATAHHFRPG